VNAELPYRSGLRPINRKPNRRVRSKATMSPLRNLALVRKTDGKVGSCWLNCHDYTHITQAARSATKENASMPIFLRMTRKKEGSQPRYGYRIASARFSQESR
jgi:hypothetical protein